MQVEIAQENRISEVEILERIGDKLKIAVDGRVYELDLVMVEEGVYSLLYKGKSFNIETIPGDGPKKYFVNTIYNTYEVEVVDPETRYLRARGGEQEDAKNQIVAPMPGKVVRVLVKKGDTVEKGQTLVIVSAMKMESEFKAEKEGTVKDIHVVADGTVTGDQIMIELE